MMSCLSQKDRPDPETIRPELMNRLEQLTCRLQDTEQSWSKSFVVRGNDAAAQADEAKLRRLLEHGAVPGLSAFKGGLVYCVVIFEDMEIVIFIY